MSVGLPQDGHSGNFINLFIFILLVVVMFKLVMGDPKTLKNIMDAIVSLIDEGPMEIDKEEVRVKAVDPSQIAMVSLTIPKDAFMEYDVTEPVIVGLNFSNLVKILNRARTGDKLELTLEDNQFVVKFISKKRKRTFHVPVIETRDIIRKEPNVEPEAVVKMLCSAFKDSLKDAVLVSSYMALEVHPDKFIFDAKGDSGKLVIEIEKDDENIREFTCDLDSVRASFSIQYLENIVKACPDTNVLELYLATNKALKIQYNIDKAALKYYLAPRIEMD